MFDFVVQNILNRYTLKELSAIYKVDLPDFKEVAKSVGGSSHESVKARYYEILNSNKFVKSNGHKVVLNLFKEANVVSIAGRLSFLDKIKLWIANLINVMISKVQNMINSLIDLVPSFLAIPVAIVLGVVSMMILFPFVLLNLFIKSIAIIRSSHTNIFLSLMMAIVSLVVGLVVAIMSFLIAPIMNAFADKLVEKSIIKKLVIGNIVNNNNVNGNLYIPLQAIANVEVQAKKSMIGKSSYFVSLEENVQTEEKVSFKDRIISLVFTNYYINKRTVLIVSENDKNIIESMATINHVVTNENKISDLVNEAETV